MPSPSLLTSMSLLGAAVAQTTSSNFNILSFNVAGLPAILNNNEVPGDKTENTKAIGRKFSEYDFDLIHVQEDFNYHAALYETDDHPHRTATSGGVPFGSGLNALANFEWVDFERIKWDECSNASGADCLTPKGFTFMRVKVAEGVWVDAVNLHADAGTEDDDNAARAANLQQVSDYIKTHSTGNPVLVFGDTNSRYTRTSDVPSIFVDENDMIDPWVDLILNGVEPTPGAEASVCDNPANITTCEIVDKVWYRGSPVVTLEATSFEYAGEMFLQDDGSILSDHNPILVDFTWSLSESLRVSDPYGGPHGTWYNDLDTIAAIDSPTTQAITLRGAERLDSISITLTSGEQLSHGGAGGETSSMTLDTSAGEILTGATVCQGEHNDHTRVFFMEVRSSMGNSVSAGTRTEQCMEMNAPEEANWGLVGVQGRAGDEIDRVAFVYVKS